MFSKRLAVVILYTLALGLFSGCSTASAKQAELESALSTAAMSTQAGEPSPTLTQKPTRTIAQIVVPTFTATAIPYHFCQPPSITIPGHFLLARPISSAANPTVDITYRYGSTGRGQYQVHHGVDLHNPKGTNVYAAADGLVVVAGGDTHWGPEYGFYGNLVIISHEIAEVGQPLYTLYGHLSQISVEVGQRVEMGRKIGEVGATGVAIGSHLHFEVRLGENSYENTRNPELWMKPPEDVETGVLAAYIIDEQGRFIKPEGLVLRYLHGSLPNSEVGNQFPEQYWGNSVNYDDEYGESFVVGDLIPGAYEIAFTHGHVYKQQVEVQPGQLTLAAFCVD
jgi:murein DD-endopeptidase MepM/ murein hydrolase activator NlpD